MHIVANSYRSSDFPFKKSTTLKRWAKVTKYVLIACIQMNALEKRIIKRSRGDKSKTMNDTNDIMLLKLYIYPTTKRPFFEETFRTFIHSFNLSTVKQCFYVFEFKSSEIGHWSECKVYFDYYSGMILWKKSDASREKSLLNWWVGTESLFFGLYQNHTRAKQEEKKTYSERWVIVFIRLKLWKVQK